jgi:hypothetical protein
MACGIGLILGWPGSARRWREILIDTTVDKIH